MVRIGALAVPLLCLTCTAYGANIPELGAALPSNAKPAGELVMTAPGELRPAYTVSISGIEYTLCEESGQLIYISTTSHAFQTPEGVHVGDTFAQVRERAPSSAQTLLGWAFVVPLPSGWNAAFVQGETMTEGQLHDETSVAWLFRRASW